MSVRQPRTHTYTFKLREYASLEKEVCITGVVDRAEIWNADKWREINQEICDNPEEIAKVMEELGF